MTKIKISAKVKKITYLEDFIRKYPNAQILSHNIVNVCLQDLGETKFCPMEYGVPSCIECWNAIKGTWKEKEIPETQKHIETE